MIVHYIHEEEVPSPTLFLWRQEHDTDKLTAEQTKFVVNTFYNDPYLDIENSDKWSWVHTMARIADEMSPISVRGKSAGRRSTHRLLGYFPGGILYVPGTGLLPETPLFRLAYGNGSLLERTPRVFCYLDSNAVCAMCERAKRLTKLLACAASGNVQELSVLAKSVTTLERVKALFTALQCGNRTSAVILLRGPDRRNMMDMLEKQLPKPPEPQPEAIVNAEAMLNLYIGSKSKRRMSV